MRKLIAILALGCVAVAAQAQTYFFTANMDAGQEVQTPPVNSPAFGKGGLRVVFDTNGRVYYEGMIRVRMLTAAPTAFHIHLADGGSNGGVAVNLGGNFNIVQVLPNGNYNIYVRGQILDRTVDGTALTRFQIVDRMRMGGSYFNVHNSNFPAGEIRGQISEIK